MHTPLRWILQLIGGSCDPLMAFTLGEIEIPALAQERMEELREQFGQRA